MAILAMAILAMAILAMAILAIVPLQVFSVGESYRWCRVGINPGVNEIHRG